MRLWSAELARPLPESAAELAQALAAATSAVLDDQDQLRDHPGDAVMTVAMTTPIRLGPADAERYMRLRRRMLADSPWAFGASLESDRMLEPERLRALLAEEHSAILACEDGPDELAAAAGLRRLAPQKFAHRAEIWGGFVEPAHRGRSLGRAVVSAALALARSWPGVDYVDLGVSERSPEAWRLYERLGFVVWGRMPETTAFEDRRYDEIFLTLRL